MKGEGGVRLGKEGGGGGGLSVCVALIAVG